MQNQAHSSTCLVKRTQCDFYTFIIVSPTCIEPDSTRAKGNGLALYTQQAKDKRIWEWFNFYNFFGENTEKLQFGTRIMRP